MNELSNCATITAYYRDKVYKTLPIDLSSQSNIELIMNISENGSNLLQYLKLPVSSNKFIVLSKAQLIESILEIEIFPEKRQSNTDSTY